MRSFQNRKLGSIGALANFDRPHGSAGRSGKHHFRARVCGNFFAERIVGIQNHCSSRAHRFHQRALFFCDCFTRTHEPDVRDADIGDDRRIGRGDL